MGVSQRNAAQIRAAMERLLNWEPENIEVLRDGDLTDANLWREAGISKATLYRAENELQEWRGRLKRIDEAEDVAVAPRARIRQMERQIAKMRTDHAAEALELRRTINILAQQIQVLTLQLQQSRDFGTSNKVVPITSKPFES